MGFRKGYRTVVGRLCVKEDRCLCRYYRPIPVDVFDSLARKVHGRHGVITKRFFDDCVDIADVFLAERHVPGISHVRRVPLDVFKGRFLYVLVFWS